MARFYGRVFGRGKTIAYRLGNTFLDTEAMSWDGVIRVKLWTSCNEDVVQLFAGPHPGKGGDAALLWGGPVRELVKLAALRDNEVLLDDIMTSRARQLLELRAKELA